MSTIEAEELNEVIDTELEKKYEEEGKEDVIEHKENKMGVMPMNKLLLTMGLPMMISMMVQALYNIVDSIFVAMISEDALTAVSMAFPMQNLLIGVGSGLGVGMNALLSRSLGEKNVKEANKVAMQGIFLAACGYLMFFVVGLLTSRSFFVIQGASEDIINYGHDYTIIVMCCSFGLFGAMTAERLLQATGKTIFSMYTQLAGAITNIILDPILIFGYFGFPKMGIAGAAIATVTGQIVGCTLGIIFNLKCNKELTFSFKGFRPKWYIIKNILIIGVPSIIMVAIGSIMSFSINKILIAFTSTAVAVFGVYFKLQSFAFMPIFGLNNGMIPIVAYNYGAKKFDRMYSCRKIAIVYAEAIMIACFLVFQIFPVKLLQLFSASDTMMSIGIPALRIISTAFLFAGFSVISSSFFQALGHSVYSMLVSIIRQLLVLVPIAFLLAQTGKVNLVWLAWPIAEAASVACCVIFGRMLNKKMAH